MQDFWNNVSRYPKYFIGITLGIFFALFERLKPLLNSPLSAIALLGILISGFFFIIFTLRAMLGLSPI
ncbi:MAG: DUF751 family protein [Coleofasciculus sp. Co-bin14]|nr:DUF751 family protein [Coleofasciculus sp. Co-bin14]